MNQKHCYVLPSAQPEQRWIPCNERLPEEDVEVLITYRYKEGEGDTSHADIDITTYGQMYFGGNKVGNHKHWDGHTEKDVTRLLSLPDVPDINDGDIISRQAAIDAIGKKSDEIYKTRQKDFKPSKKENDYAD